jgi:hypothetical protein
MNEGSSGKTLLKDTKTISNAKVEKTKTMSTAQCKSYSRRRPRVAMSLLSMFICTELSMGFLHQQPTRLSGVSSSHFRIPTTSTAERERPFNSLITPFSPSALNVWWFGGTAQNEVNHSDESCELVAVRIEKTSANSRKIAGEISVSAKMDDVWSILTDYDRLAIHVPNLMDSKITQRYSQGEQGDGSFRCRLFQKGAQKIIGFDFSATVTMDMTEKIVNAAASDPSNLGLREERIIGFKCVESQFFSVFDGEWKVKEQLGPDGEVETNVSYSVDVRPKGPVPVAALEWRIREDVPTNLRAVKAAALKIGRRNNVVPVARNVQNYVKNGARSLNGQLFPSQLVPALVDWDRDETMAKYL